MAWAFWWVSGVSPHQLNASSIPNTLGNITSAPSSGRSPTGYGAPTAAIQDHVKIESVTVDSAFTSRNFTVQVGIGGVWTDVSMSVGRCVWYGTDCKINRTGNVSYNTSPVSIRLHRNSNIPYTTIPSGTTIATIVLRQYSKLITGTNGVSTTITYQLNGDLSMAVPTCDVKDFDNKVLLPTVKTTDLLGNGAGRYAKAKKPFTINLECKDSPKVSVTFTGTIMGSNDEVLQNLESNNPNVGIQLEYIDNYSTAKTTVKNGTAFQVLQNAGANETLNFNSYYYYKGSGSAVNGGLVKSNAEFLFTYE
jgi:type 1 fimbria pilin